MSLKWSPKDPDEVLDYLLRWGKRLAGDTIVTSNFTVATGDVVINSQSTTADVPDDDDETDYGVDSAVLIWLSGGTIGNSPSTLLCRITTAGGRTMDQTVSLVIKAK